MSEHQGLSNYIILTSIMKNWNIWIYIPSFISQRIDLLEKNKVVMMSYILVGTNFLIRTNLVGTLVGTNVVAIFWGIWLSKHFEELFKK